jgi:hypothetical protein
VLEERKIPDEVQRLLGRCLASKRETRPRDAADLADQLLLAPPAAESAEVKKPVGPTADPVTGYGRKKLRQAKISATIANEEEPASPPAIKKVILNGHWVSENGDTWTLSADLQITGSQANGFIHWTLDTCPPHLPYANRVGETGCEFVKGSSEAGCLILKGYKTDDPSLVGLAEYTIVIDSDTRVFSGKSRSRQWGTGKLSGTATFKQ